MRKLQMRKLKKFIAGLSIMTLMLTTTQFQGIAIAAELGFQKPTATHAPNNWTTPENGLADDGLFATETSEGEEQGYVNFDFSSIPAGSTIDGIEVQAKAKASDDSGCRLQTKLSWNNDGNSTSRKNAAISGTSSVVTFGGAADTWGHSWTVSELSDANFLLKVSFDDVSGNNCVNGTTASLDFIQAKIYFTAPVVPVANPVIGQSCGLDMALLIDSSGSIDSTELVTLKNAFNAFVTAFSPATPTQFSVIDMDSTAKIIQAFTADATLVNAAIDSVTSGGATNWQDGLAKAQSSFTVRPNPNVVILASDGNPNRTGNPAQTVSEAAAVNAAAIVANSLKSSGTRVLTLAIGNDLNINNLKAVSGTNVDTGLTSDVITTDFSTLANDLAVLSKQLCGGTITATHIIDADGDLNTTGDQTTEAGWNFNVGGSNQVTDIDGKTAAVELIPGTYNVTETSKSGYEFISASCTGATGNGNPGLNEVTGIQLNSDDIISCVFFDKPLAGSLLVKKQVINDDGGTAVAGDFILNVTGGNSNPASFPGDENGTKVTVTANTSYSVSEDANVNYAVSYEGDCSGTMAPGASKTCTVINNDIAVTTGSLTVVKVVTNDNGGTAQVADYTLNVADSNQTLTTVVSGVANDFEAGTFVVSESGPAGYNATFSGDCDSNGNVIVTVGQAAVCTITNDDIQPQLIVIKQVNNTHGGTKSAADFIINASGTGISQSTFAGSESGTMLTLNAGPYSVDETSISGYLKTLSSECSGTISIGEIKTCTISDSDTPAELTVIKNVINNINGDSVAADFTLIATGNQATPSSFSGSEVGTVVILGAGEYSVTEPVSSGFTASFSEGCSGNISIGEERICTVTNTAVIAGGGGETGGGGGNGGGGSTGGGGGAGGSAQFGQSASSGVSKDPVITLATDEMCNRDKFSDYKGDPVTRWLTCEGIAHGFKDNDVVFSKNSRILGSHFAKMLVRASGKVTTPHVIGSSPDLYVNVLIKNNVNLDKATFSNTLVSGKEATRITKELTGRNISFDNRLTRRGAALKLFNAFAAKEYLVKN